MSRWDTISIIFEWKYIFPYMKADCGFDRHMYMLHFTFCIDKKRPLLYILYTHTKYIFSISSIFITFFFSFFIYYLSLFFFDHRICIIYSIIKYYSKYAKPHLLHKSLFFNVILYIFIINLYHKYTIMLEKQ
jgi:hypothetical protein